MTEDQKKEARRRYLLGIRCAQWLSLKGQTQIGRQFGISQKQVSALLNDNRKPRVLTQEQANEVKRLARHSRRVKKIYAANGINQLRREYGEAVRKVCNGGPNRKGKKAERESPVKTFLMMPATSGQGVTGYY